MKKKSRVFVEELYMILCIYMKLLHKIKKDTFDELPNAFLLG